MIEHAKRESRRAITEKRQEFETRLAKIRQEEERLKQAQDSADRPRKKQVCVYSPIGVKTLYQLGNSDLTTQHRNLLTMTTNLFSMTMIATQTIKKGRMTLGIPTASLQALWPC